MHQVTSETVSDEIAGILEQGESGRAKGIEGPERQDFGHIYRLYSRRVFSLCLRMTGNVDDAEDLTQQAFFQVYQKLDTFRGESSFYAWLHRLAVNEVLMRLRKRRLLKEDSLEELMDPDSRSSAWPATEARLSGASSLRAIERVDTERALNQLPPGFRTILILHDIEGYEHLEISALLGCSINTSKSQLHRARRRMRKLTQEAPGQKRGEERGLAKGSREESVSYGGIYPSKRYCRHGCYHGGYERGGRRFFPRSSRTQERDSAAEFHLHQEGACDRRAKPQEGVPSLCGAPINS
jgi:RNA polymerase sigma-70 factor (ECF subfamily)